MSWFYILLAIIAVTLAVLSILWLQFPIFITIAAVIAATLVIMSLYRRYLIKKVSKMAFCDKVESLNNIAEPFGYFYKYPEDIFGTTIDAWQRDFGYTRLFDQSAALFGMVFDCEPVYFNYEGKTWLIEFWKGQYGMNAGAEVGIYHADGIISKKKRNKVVFESAEDHEMLKISYRLLDKKRHICSVSGIHWWLTSFSVGSFAKPRDLSMVVCTTFPNQEMRDAFIDGLMELGYDTYDMDICRQSVCFSFTSPRSRQPDFVKPWRLAWTQMKNHLFSRLYLFVTRPFDNTLDRLTFLRLHLPFFFRRTVSMKKISKRFKKAGRFC